MKEYLTITIASILALSAPGIAKAQLYVTADIGGVPTVSGATLENFDEPTPSILTLSGPAFLVTGTTPNGHTPPYFSGSTAAFFGESPIVGYDNSQYVAVEPGGSATLSFTTPQHYLGLMWGSVDPYDSMNLLTFYDSANNAIGIVDGGEINSLLGGIQTGSYVNGYVNIISASAFASVVATASPTYPESFEFDDVAYAQVVPEPTSLSLLAFGLFVITLFYAIQPSFSSDSQL